MLTVDPLSNLNFSSFPFTSRAVKTLLGRPPEARALSYSLASIPATYSYSSSSDLQFTDYTFFLDSWQQAAKWFSLPQFLQKVPHAGQFFFAKGWCLAQNLHLRSCVSFEGFSGTLFFFLPGCFPFSSFTKRMSC